MLEVNSKVLLLTESLRYWEAMAAGNWMRTDKATHTKEGAASSHPMGGGEADEHVQPQ